MRKFIGSAVLVAAMTIVMRVQSAQAGIISYSSSWTGGDGIAAPSGALNSPATGDLSLNVTGGETAGTAVGGLIGTSEGDPNLFIHNSFNNDTSFAWPSYEVDVILGTTAHPGVPFTISNIVTASPSGWSPTVSAQFSPAAGEFEDILIYSGPSPLPIGGTFDFAYELSFASTGGSFGFTQNLTPLPEPTSVGLLAVGGISMLTRRRRTA